MGVEAPPEAFTQEVAVEFACAQGRHRGCSASIRRKNPRPKCARRDIIRPYAPGRRVDRTSVTAGHGLLRRLLNSPVHAMLISVFRGTYGKCAACGRQIEVPRLEAVPWAV